MRKKKNNSCKMEKTNGKSEKKKKYKWQLNMWKYGQLTSNKGISYKPTYSKTLIHNNKLARNLIFS